MTTIRQPELPFATSNPEGLGDVTTAEQVALDGILTVINGSLDYDATTAGKVRATHGYEAGDSTVPPVGHEAYDPLTATEKEVGKHMLAKARAAIEAATAPPSVRL